MKWLCRHCGRYFIQDKKWNGKCSFCSSSNICNGEIKVDLLLVADYAILDVLDANIPELNRQVLNDARVELERIYKILKSK